MKFPDKVYDVLKWLSLVVFDAVGLFYKTLAGVWGFPYGDQVMATCVAISVFIGALIGISTAEYRKSIAQHSEEDYK